MTRPRASDDLARELLESVRAYRRLVGSVGWPDAVERSVWLSLEASLVLFLRHLAALEAAEAPAVQSMIH